jgi:hypothetical protein
MFDTIWPTSKAGTGLKRLPVIDQSIWKLFALMFAIYNLRFFELTVGLVKAQLLYRERTEQSGELLIQ